MKNYRLFCWKPIDFLDTIYYILIKTHPKRIKPSSQTPPKTPPPLSPKEKSRFLAQHLYRNATSLLRDKTLRSGSMALALTVRFASKLLVVVGKNMGRYEFTNLLVCKPTKLQQKTINKETGWLFLLGEKNFTFHKPELRLLWKDSSKHFYVWDRVKWNSPPQILEYDRETVVHSFIFSTGFGPLVDDEKRWWESGLQLQDTSATSAAFLDLPWDMFHVHPVLFHILLSYHIFIALTITEIRFLQKNPWNPFNSAS